MNLSNDILRALVHGPLTEVELLRKVCVLSTSLSITIGLLLSEMCEYGLIRDDGGVFTITDIGRSELE